MHFDFLYLLPAASRMYPTRLFRLQDLQIIHPANGVAPQMVRDRGGRLHARLHLGRDVSQEAWGSPRNPGTDRGSR
jgi:hypothetical protein